jgi:hypothetical protein
VLGGELAHVEPLISARIAEEDGGDLLGELRFPHARRPGEEEDAAGPASASADMRARQAGDRTLQDVHRLADRLRLPAHLLRDPFLAAADAVAHDRVLPRIVRGADFVRADGVGDARKAEAPCSRKLLHRVHRPHGEPFGEQNELANQLLARGGCKLRIVEEAGRGAGGDLLSLASVGQADDDRAHGFVTHPEPVRQIACLVGKPEHGIVRRRPAPWRTPRLRLVRHLQTSPKQPIHLLPRTGKRSRDSGGVIDRECACGCVRRGSLDTA